MTHIQSYPHVTSFDVEAFKSRLKTRKLLLMCDIQKRPHTTRGYHPLGGIILLHQVERLVSLPWDGSDLWLDRAGHGWASDKNPPEPAEAE